MSSLAPTLTPLPPHQQHSPTVITCLGMNPGPYTLQGTNTYLIGSGKHRILVDTAEGGPEYIDNIKSALQQYGVSGLQEVIITHWHNDHTQGLEDVLRSFKSADGNQLKVHKLKTGLRGAAPSSLQYQPVTAAKSLAEAMTEYKSGSKKYTVFRTECATLLPLYTPGHTSDHICLYHVEEQTLLSGDTVLGAGTAVFARLHPYLNSLQTIVQAKPSVIYPGHGPVITDGVDRVEMYIHHRQERERQIVAELQAAKQQGTTAPAIVKAIYPSDLHERVIPAAINNVVLHLEKLSVDGVVQAYDQNDQQMAIANESTGDDDAGDADVGGEQDNTQKERTAQRAQWRWVYVSNSSRQSSL